MFAGYSGYNQFNPTIVPSRESDGIFFNSLSELENQADLIVEAKVLKDSNQYISKDSDGTPVYGYTITPVEINRIIKPFSGKNDQKSIDIIEPYYTFTIFTGKKYLQTLEKYSPLNNGNKYILFLRKEKSSDFTIYTGDNLFSCIGAHQGKYVISPKVINLNNDEELTSDNLQILKVDKKYKEFYKEVISKYKK